MIEAKYDAVIFGERPLEEGDKTRKIRVIKTHNKTHEEAEAWLLSEAERLEERGFTPYKSWVSIITKTRIVGRATQE